MQVFYKHDLQCLPILTAPSVAPEDIQVTAEDSTTLHFSWQPPANGSTNGVIQRYIINITEVNTDISFQLETTPDTLFIVVSNLHPYYQYRCMVAAETVGLGPFSTPVIIELPEDGKTTVISRPAIIYYTMCMRL